MRQAIVDNEDHESEVESDESVEVHSRASKRPQRVVMQSMPQPGGQPVHNEICAFQVRPSPARVWGGECTPLTSFQLFWDDNLFDYKQKFACKKEFKS